MRGRTQTSRRNVSHQLVAVVLRNQPGVWQEVGEYPSVKGAEDTVRRIQTAYKAEMYRPAGTFEARYERTEFGARVTARYVGNSLASRVVFEPSAKTPAANIPPTQDYERVLGQIKRGEVLAGPEGARRIAARHMEAYGNAVWGSRDNDAAWADALAALPQGGEE